MTPKYDEKGVTIYHGDSVEVMRTLPENSVDSIVTDPPYGLSFMGKKWDYDVPSVQLWAEALRVLKPGGHLLSFAGSRTYHRMAVNIEDAGFEIRDQIMWLYGSGFPKSLDISKAIDKAAGAEREVVGFDKSKFREIKEHNQTKYSDFRQEDYITKANITVPATPEAAVWDGWGTALKPAHEPIVVARKPLDGTVAENVLKHGTGGINIDGGRVEAPDGVPKFTHRMESSQNCYGDGKNGSNRTGEMDTSKGRFPANIILDAEAGAILDKQSGELHGAGNIKPMKQTKSTSMFYPDNSMDGTNPNMHNDSGGASRFFYCAKTSKQDRDEGLDNIALIIVSLESCEKNIINQVRLARLLVDMETLPPKVIAESGTGTKRGNEWSMSLCGKALTGQFQTECKSTISTKSNSIIESKILKSLTHCITKEFTADVNSGTENGGSPVVSVDKNNTLTITINEKLASVLGVKNAASKMQLKINVSAGQNIHSTVKPTALMQYLLRLVTPPGGTTYDPFLGSGSTGKAAVREGFKFIGSEREAEYIPISIARINAPAQVELL